MSPGDPNNPQDRTPADGPTTPAPVAGEHDGDGGGEMAGEARALRSVPHPDSHGGAHSLDSPVSLDELLQAVSRGDHDAFAQVFDRISAQVLGVVRRVVRDPAQTEEVGQEVLIEVWRTAARFQPERGSAATWILTMAHRRAVDRVRSAQSATDREVKVAYLDHTPDYDVVLEQVETRLEQEQVRRCLGSLTQLQRESLMLAYYGGNTYREVALELDVPLGTVKTRLRDGLIRLRDCLGMSA